MGCKYKQRNKIFKQSYYILSRLFSLIFFKGKELGRHLSLTRTSEEFRFLLRRSGLSFKCPSNLRTASGILPLPFGLLAKLH